MASGASVVFCGSDVVAGELLQDGLMVADDQTVGFVPADVSDGGSVTDLVDLTELLLGGIDILCHSVGAHPESDLGSTSDEMWQDVMNATLTSSMTLTRSVLAHLSAGEDGRVILVSSCPEPRPGVSVPVHHSTSQSGMEGFARAAALELAPAGITVNMLSVSSSGAERAPDDAWSGLGQSVAFLASARSSLVTGQLLSVVGSRSLAGLRN